MSSRRLEFAPLVTGTESDRIVEKNHEWSREFIKGNVEPAKKMFSLRDDAFALQVSKDLPQKDEERIHQFRKPKNCFLDYSVREPDFTRRCRKGP